MTLSDVARFLAILWNTDKEIHKRHLARKHSRPNLKNLRSLAIDEIPVSKGIVT